jgi:hypothetical protein
MTTRISQAQADDAAAKTASFWPEFGRRWPWTRAPEYAPVYQRIGEQTVTLLRAFPAIQWSNQARWYRRVVRETPAIIVLTPDALRAEAGAVAQGAGPQAMDGKHVLSLIYPPDQSAAQHDADDSADEPSVAKTLLASTALGAPYYTAQLAHELLNCFCHTEWDGRTMRSGLRLTSGAVRGGAEEGAALNDLLLDAMLVHYLPSAGPMQPADLFEGAQGPYWRIARTLSARLRGVAALPALFSGSPDARERFEHGVAVALDTPDAATQLDILAAVHDWDGLRRLLGADDR